MIIISRGWGLVVPIIVVIITFAVTTCMKFFDQNLPTLQWLSITCMISSVILWPLGRYLNTHSRKKSEELDILNLSLDERIERIFEESKNTFYFIPVEYWGIILIVLSLVFQIVQTE
ncbi:MAG: hypothetical protein D8M58_02960 [Calditrichaeota bacterium]|nr:MAG: hypothetical protein DWQ03_04120 [Calditrichota bacterium]MBL1204325.1 hypothetical protein [Calditrichota bacterium]NOG44154.1 hypothetical protein [Calditrichota bacterium]